MAAFKVTDATLLALQVMRIDAPKVLAFLGLFTLALNDQIEVLVSCHCLTSCGPNLRACLTWLLVQLHEFCRRALHGDEFLAPFTLVPPFVLMSSVPSAGCKRQILQQFTFPLPGQAPLLWARWPFLMAKMALVVHDGLDSLNCRLVHQLVSIYIHIITHIYIYIYMYNPHLHSSLLHVRFWPGNLAVRSLARDIFQTRTSSHILHSHLHISSHSHVFTI